VSEGGAVAASLTSPSDPSSADTAAGFHYSFALSSAGLASTYAAAGTANSASFAFDDGPADQTIYARIFDKDGGYTDYQTAVHVNNVAPSAVVLTPSATTINENQSITLSGTFRDPGTSDTHLVVINWGDGSANTTVNLAAGVLSFGGVAHQYLDNP